ncbi:phosphate-starvation-inducible PsiE family protein [Thiocapsa bogorovii]|uniref:phosphate-starvation-inducible PsiE family protein n=1 Tax=Thiocapsa bogorovii TaxID=521689 RepID=UPI001E2B71CA|nr:phosphate-starvation-inducible PsiE family protein [Thiocapsa bogorovii]UHD15865.1 phosphate-starvation-inducible PsiE family protein [Thiocapsa bogorovii]
MDRNRFDIQFSGDLVPGTDVDTARQRIQHAFNLSDAALRQLFGGTSVTVRRGVDGETAARYQAAFRDAGAMIRIVPAPSERPPQPLSLDPFGWTGQGPNQAQTQPRPKSVIDRSFHYFEKALAAVLLVLISVVAVIAVIELCFVLYKDIVSQQGLFLLDLSELFEVFGMFLIVLIAIELMASIYMYMTDKSVHVEIMLLIAITALTRKVVVLDLESKGDPALYMLGLAALLGTLVAGYYLVKRLAGPGDGH